MSAKATTYRNRKWLIILAMVVIAVVVYRNNISKTIAMYAEYSSMEKKMSKGDDLAGRAAWLERRLSGNDAQAKRDSLTQSQMLHIISQACSKYQLKLVRFGDPVVYNQKQYQVELNLITLEGNFVHLTECIHWLETSNALQGNIMSVEYKLVKSYAGRGDKLVATCYLQRVSGGKRS